jgi:hypothetical protein
VGVLFQKRKGKGQQQKEDIPIHTIRVVLFYGQQKGE